MPRVIAILEDDPRRTAAMRQVLSKVASDLEQKVFDNSPDMIEWLEAHFEDVVLLSLDHDLNSHSEHNGEVVDPGSGRDVADYLATRPCSYPVIIHSTNYNAVLGMCRALDDAAWKFSCVVPHDDLDWISSTWAQLLSRILRQAKS